MFLRNAASRMTGSFRSACNFITMRTVGLYRSQTRYVTTTTISRYNAVKLSLPTAPRISGAACLLDWGLWIVMRTASRIDRRWVIVTLVSSGGLDSTLMAVLAKKRGIPHLPCRNYGQPSAEAVNLGCLSPLLTAHHLRKAAVTNVAGFEPSFGPALPIRKAPQRFETHHAWSNLLFFFWVRLMVIEVPAGLSR